MDQGYDISDCRSIDKIFGTIADLKEMLLEAKKVGVRVLLDFVPNHTSDEHEWFKLSENRTAGYEDYYVWVDGEDGIPPNNWVRCFDHLPLDGCQKMWKFRLSFKFEKNSNHLIFQISIFKGSAWKWSDKRKQYYLHQFHYKQPDLNFNNPIVLQELKVNMLYIFNFDFEIYARHPINSGCARRTISTFRSHRHPNRCLW